MEGLAWLLSHEEEGFVWLTNLSCVDCVSLCNSNGSQWDSEDFVKSACCVNDCHQEGRKGGLFGGR